VIDVEVTVYNRVATAVRTAWPQAFLTSEYTRSPPAFPCVSVVEIENTAYIRSQDIQVLVADGMEHHAIVVYEVNVFSNLAAGRKTEARTLLMAVDDVFREIQFSRMMMNAVPNMEDATIYRLLARYRAVVGEDGQVYRR
jgi:hypothetical protein